MRIIGIDPGINGALAVIEDKKLVEVIDLPTMSEGKKNKRQIKEKQIKAKQGKSTQDQTEQSNAKQGKSRSKQRNYADDDDYDADDGGEDDDDEDDECGGTMCVTNKLRCSTRSRKSMEVLQHS